MKGDFLETRPGYCKCGCGIKTTIAKRNDTKRGLVKGKPVRFLQGHHTRLGKNNPMSGITGRDHPMYGIHKFGKSNPNWNGGTHIVKKGNVSYVMVLKPEHPRSDSQGYVKEHIMTVEDALGWPLPMGAVVHHIDGNGTNNELSNLMVFKNSAEHLKHHAKMRKGAK